MYFVGKCRVIEKMKKWDDNFDMESNVNGQKITIGKQNFENGTIMIRQENGNIIDCPLFFDTEGNIYFIYNNMGVYISEYLGDFQI